MPLDDVRLTRSGSGPTIVIVHAGLDDGTDWAKVDALLQADFHVVRLHRRQYRLDLDAPVSIADEVADVAAVVASCATPVVLVGHSSGGIVALETALVAADTLAGLVVYEPPIPVDGPLGGDAQQRARRALDDGSPGKALAIFVTEVVEAPRWLSPVLRASMPLMGRYRPLLARQIADLEALNALGVRTAAYADVAVPTLLLGGDKSPAHLGRRLDVLQRTLHDVERVTLPGVGHDANRRQPQLVATTIAKFARRVFGG